MAAECDDLGHSRAFVAQIGQSGGAKVVESQWAFYTRPFADLAKGLPENVFIGVWLARLFVDDNMDAGALRVGKHLPRFLTERFAAPV